MKLLISVTFCCLLVAFTNSDWLYIYSPKTQKCEKVVIGFNDPNTFTKYHICEIIGESNAVLALRCSFKDEDLGYIHYAKTAEYCEELTKILQKIIDVHKDRVNYTRK